MLDAQVQCIPALLRIVMEAPLISPKFVLRMKFLKGPCFLKNSIIMKMGVINWHTLVSDIMHPISLQCDMAGWILMNQALITWQKVLNCILLSKFHVIYFWTVYSRKTPITYICFFKREGKKGHG